MSDKDNQRKALARQFLDLLAGGKPHGEIYEQLDTSGETLKKWCYWYYPEEATKYNWKVNGNKTPIYKGRKKKRIKKVPTLITMPIPQPPETAPTPVVRSSNKNTVTALVFRGDAASVAEMVRGALGGANNA